MVQDIPPSVGFIGLGRMGKPMALNLLKAGTHLVIHSRSQGPISEVTSAGAHPAGYPGEVAALADIVFTCLPDEAACESVYLGQSGLIEGCRSTNLFVETSTISPTLAQKFAEAAAAQGAAFVDAPISGGVGGARDATLTIMAGGEAKDIDRARPFLLQMGSMVHHVGRVGKGEVVKLINQLLVAVHTQAACDAMVLAIKAGADARQVLDVLSTSWGNSAMLGRTGPMVADADYGSAAPTRLIAKDIGLVAGLAADAGITLPLVAATHTVIERAMAEGLSETDVAALATLIA
jgi:3-hydroxyisobutyrate dehydrogenase-like beta-hydroxyacid dehydrogenase